MYRYIYMHMYYTSGDTYGLEVVCIYITIFLCVVSHSVIPDSLRPHGLPSASDHGILQAVILEWVCAC